MVLLQKRFKCPTVLAINMAAEVKTAPKSSKLIELVMQGRSSFIGVSTAGALQEEIDLSPAADQHFGTEFTFSSCRRRDLVWTEYFSTV